MSAGDVKLAFGASTAFTQTNLDGLASSATWVAGWESNAVDNSTNLYEDYLITGSLQAESAGLTAGEIRVGIVAEQDDTTWPDVFDGTESAETISHTGVRDAIVKIGAVVKTDTTASQVYDFGPFSVASLFGGICPRKFVVFIAHSMVAALETTGDPNNVWYKGVYHTIAQA
jgi:hypothetical protein